MERVSIFVDIQNIYYTTKQCFNSHFDYNYFWRKITNNRDVIFATAYAIESNDPKQRQFHHILRGIGFDVKLKPFIKRADNTAKGDWDVGITIDVMDYAKKSDIIVLASGDGDFHILIDEIKNRYDLSAEIYGVKPLTSNFLINSASIFQPINEKFLIKK
ncbi:MAG: NYN domain-containing protein [Candidatus Neomarinimicrobiota bacterium]|nr:NYN domain-containing protein [Candidatus Neomarinimicrobiota bacterium]|tara:strand:- start:852 stop:1331 length:480 start_codon:yes stop_codon:yes gene_type:complete